MSQRYYSFKVVTYNTDLDCIKPLLSACSDWAYILHDKDDVDPHFHVLCVFKQPKSFKRVCDYVLGNQNTFARLMTSKYDDYDYLIHKDIPDKFHYDSQERFCSRKSYWELTKKENDIREFLEDLISDELTEYDMALKYGRDYIRHRLTYRDFGDLLLSERSRNLPLSEINDNDPFDEQLNICADCTNKDVDI